MTERFDFNGSLATGRTVVVRARNVTSATSSTRACALPAPRHGSQAYFWTPDWQRRELLADYDFLVGDVYEPEDVDDLIRELDEDD